MANDQYLSPREVVQGLIDKMQKRDPPNIDFEGLLDNINNLSKEFVVIDTQGPTRSPVAERRADHLNDVARELGDLMDRSPEALGSFD